MKETETMPVALMAPVETMAGQQILIGRSDIDIKAGSLIAIATGEDNRRWLLAVDEPHCFHGSHRCIGELVLE